MDDFITLGDGNVKVEDDVIVSGSRISVRDHFPILTDEQEDEALRKALRQPQRVATKVPKGMKWCSSGLKHEPPYEDAVLPLDAFTDDVTRADAKHPYCNLCRAEMERRSYAHRIASRGHAIKTYNPRKPKPNCDSCDGRRT